MSQKYTEYKQLQMPAIEQEFLAYWKSSETFKKSITQRSGSKPFVFFEGPPSANGLPGIHHVISRTLKDLICRYKTMQGFEVNRKAGWDTHGLPVELGVEKELGITKEDIGKTISVADYNKKCREVVMRYKDKWDGITEQMGYWVDLSDPYITFDNNYIETLWWALKELYKKDYLYKSVSIQPYSPAAGTGLSSHELNQPGTYKDVKDTTVVAMFEAIQDEASAPLFAKSNQEKIHFLAWTTTPWTLPSNCGLTVGGAIEYSLVKTINPYTKVAVHVVLATALLGKFFKEEFKGVDFAIVNENEKALPWEVVATYKGKDLEGMRYHQLMPFEANAKAVAGGDPFRVIVGDFVTTEDGTGIVHTAPAFGADDYKVGAKNNIGILVMVDREGKFIDGLGPWSARFVKNYKDAADYKDIDVDIAVQLKLDGKAFKVEKYEHTYPHCWRTDKPIIYYPLDAWFIRTTAVKDRMIELNKTINWKPKATGEGRFGNWLENMVDWNLSRSRYWGTPLPIWATEDGTERICIGSIEELKSEIEKANAQLGLQQVVSDESVDLHKPFVDEWVLVAPSGKAMRREPDLIDVWFDSGAMPYAQWHYPFENKDIFEANFPADYIAEGVDQTRGWFFTLHALSVMLFDSVSFKNVIANGLVLDKNGNKMSKRLGNAIDPFKTLKEYGPDALRWYLLSNANPWDNLKFNLDGVTEVQRRFFGTLQNTYNFFALYANLDAFVYRKEKAIPVQERAELDQWILSKLQSLILEVEGAMDGYDATKATRAIQNFTVDQLSNWYVRLARKRFWRGDMQADKQAADETLYECLFTLSQLMSSFAPFYADWLYKNLTEAGETAKESVHLTDWISANHSLINPDLETSMDLAQTISSSVHSLRKKEKIKVRQPLQRILVPVLSEKFKSQVAHVAELIQTEVNIKEIEYLDDASGILVKQIKPNLPLLGKKLGPKMRFVVAALQNWGPTEIGHIETEGHFILFVEGEEIDLLLEEVLISSQDIPGWSVASDQGVTVALDVNLTEELKQEGIARDLVNRIQNLRKDLGLEVQDKIKLLVADSNAEVNAAIAKFGSYIQDETQAISLSVGTIAGEQTVLDMDEFELAVQLLKA